MNKKPQNFTKKEKTDCSLFFLKFCGFYVIMKKTFSKGCEVTSWQVKGEILGGKKAEKTGYDLQHVEEGAWMKAL